jgi:hypothetical protein
VAQADYLTEWFGSVPVLGLTVNDYPAPVAGLSCVVGGARVYCIGGLNGTAQTTSSTYTALLSTTGVGEWMKLPDYPTGIAGESCVVYAGYVYCVGGLQSAEKPKSPSQVTRAVYFAPLTASGGIGEWSRATDYPFGVYDQSCAVLQGYIYCVGGILANSTRVSAVEYAGLSPSGIAAWMRAASYPLDISAESCSAYATRLYCIGGLNATSTAVPSVYYGSVNESGLSWTVGTSYPIPVAGQSCVIHYPGLYCIGGLSSTVNATRVVVFSYINGTRLSWTGCIYYPVYTQSQSCVSYLSQIYCIGGNNGLEFLEFVYFTSIGSTQTTAVETTALTTSSVASHSAQGPSHAPAMLVLAAALCAVILVTLLWRRTRSSTLTEAGKVQTRDRQGVKFNHSSGQEEFEIRAQPR